MTIDHVLISKSPGETRVAMVSNGRLDGLTVARDGLQSVVGNIYLGRVETVVKNLNAAFVNIGTGRDGFLAVPEVRPQGMPGDGKVKDSIGDYVKEGDAVLVQATRDAIEGKGPKLTANVNLAGVNLVFQPGRPGVHISRRIEDVALRDRLTAALEGLCPEGDGFIVRTAAADAGPENLEKEAETLAGRWRDIRLERANTKAPALLFAEPGPGIQALRDLAAEKIEKIIVDDAEILAEIKNFCEAEAPGLLDAVEMHSGQEPMFEAFGIEELIDAALSPTVALSGGGSLIIGQTAALCAIDVNAGGADQGSKEQTAFDANMEAAAEAARQIVLRNISGLIVIDFLAMRDAAQKSKVLGVLKKSLASDAMSPRVFGYTGTGLVELTRRRQGLSLLHLLGGADEGNANVEPVKSALTAALEAVRAVLKQGTGAAAVTLKAPPVVIEVLKAPGTGETAIRQAEERLGLAITLEADQTFQIGQFDVVTG